jgi:hypothetical protein
MNNLDTASLIMMTIFSLFVLGLISVAYFTLRKKFKDEEKEEKAKSDNHLRKI